MNASHKKDGVKIFYEVSDANPIRELITISCGIWPKNKVCKDKLHLD